MILPDTSVVMVTWNRADMLDEALASISRLEPAPAEVIVVDDGSTDDTRTVVANHGAVYVRIEHAGIAAARNAGWQSARGSIIAMTDDDCVVTPGWLGFLVAPIVEGAADIVQGKVLPRDDHADRVGPWSRTLRVVRDRGSYQTANIAYRRTFMEQAGGFDPSLARVGEDADLAWRIKKLGGRTSFSDDALVRHAVWPNSYLDHLRSRPKWADLALVYRRHPELRFRLHHRIFFHRRHERLLIEASVMGAIAVALSPLYGLAAVLAAIGLRSLEAEPRQVIRQFPLSAGQMLVDLVEVVCFARASLRHRVVVL